MDSYLNVVYGISVSLLFAIGFFVLIENYKNKIGWVFFFYALGGLGWMISIYLCYQLADLKDFNTAQIVIRLSYVFSVIGMTLMTVFFYYFPRVTYHVSAVAKSIYGLLTIVVVILSAVTPFIHKSMVITDGIYSGDILGDLYFLYLFSILLNFLLSLALALNKIYSTRGIERNKISFVFLGYIFGVFLAVITNVVLPVFGFFIFQREAPILGLFFGIPAFYAIQKYRFFNLSYISLKLVRTIILYIIFLLTIFLAYKLLLYFSPEGNGIILSGFSIILGLIVLDSAEKYIPVFISESFREFRNALTGLESKIYFCDNYEKLQTFIEKTFLLKLNLVNARVYIVRKKKINLDIPVYIQNKFTDELKKYKKNILVRDEIGFMDLTNMEKQYLLSSMNKLEADLCFPLFSENNLIGFFVLRRRESDPPFSEEEFREIFKIKDDLEIVLMNILLKMNLEEENNLMQTIIDKKTKDLKEKVQQVKELLRQQSDFIAITAHEFRTPLSIALFQLEEILKQKNKKRTQAQLNKDLKVIDNSLDNLKVLTQKLFAVQQYDLNKVKLQKEKTDIKKYIDEIYKDFSILMKEKKLDFSLDNKLKDKTYYEIDKSQMRQVMQNILTNAYKFTPENGKIRLSARKHGENILIKVSDNGKGIPKELKKAIFEKFKTSGSSGTGIGLGLYVCKKIIDLHKGKIWAESSELGGAAFCVELRK
jgi:signal transduction histidine kinase